MVLRILKSSNYLLVLAAEVQTMATNGDDVDQLGTYLKNDQSLLSS